MCIRDRSEAELATVDEASFKREDYLLFLMTEYSQLKLLGPLDDDKDP